VATDSQRESAALPNDPASVPRDMAARVAAFEQIASSTPGFIYMFDLTGRFLYANQRLLDVWGLPFEQAVGKSMLEIGYPDWHAAMHLREIAQVIETKQPIKGNVGFTGGSGISGTYEYIFTPVLGADGNVEVIAGTTRDVTERAQLEAERERLLASLEAERANLAAIIESSPAFIVTLRGPNHVVELANKEYYKVVGQRELVGKATRDALPEVVDQGFIDLLDRVYRTGDPFVGNEVPALLGPEGAGEQHYVNFVYQALRDADGNVDGIFVHGVDVTDSVRSREVVRQSAEPRGTGGWGASGRFSCGPPGLASARNSVAISPAAHAADFPLWNDRSSFDLESPYGPSAHHPDRRLDFR
jgi:PAS domain S-box-containing protein